MEQGTKILMIVKEAEARAAYEEALQRAGARYDVADSFNELLRLTVDNSYNGLLIDLLTLVRSSKEEKIIAYDCINFYPSLRVKWDARRKSMSLSPLEQSKTMDPEGTLAHFVQKKCKSFTARSLRRFDRKDTFLSLVLSVDGSFGAGDSLKTFTVNVSQGGAFVQTAEPPEKGETVWLRFLEMPEEEAVQAEVCWRTEWGSRSIPGVGVRYRWPNGQVPNLFKKMANL